MRVYIIEKWGWCEYAGIVFVTADKKAAEQYCKQKNKTSRDCDYNVVTKQLKGFEHGK